MYELMRYYTIKALLRQRFFRRILTTKGWSNVVKNDKKTYY